MAFVLPNVRPLQFNKGLQAPLADTVPADVRERYQALREDIIKLEGAVTEAENNGDDSGAKFKMMLMADVNEKIQELEAEHPGLTAPAPPMQAAPPAPVQAPAPVQIPQQLMPPMQMFEPLNYTQQQALMYEQQKAMNREMDAEVKEFQEKYAMQDRHVWPLNEQLKQRNNSFDDDLWAVDEIMSKCGNTAQRVDLLNMNIRWMQEGKFCGAYSPNPEVIKAAEKFNLDPPAACKLAHALETREDAGVDMERINRHLERSNKPSSLVMMFLKTLKAGGIIDEDYRPVAVGSWLHKHEQKQRGDDRDAKQRGKRSRSRRRSRSDRRGSGGGGGGGYGGRGRQDNRDRRDDYRGRSGRDDSRGRGRRDARGAQSNRRNDSRDRQRDSGKGGQSWNGQSTSWQGNEKWNSEGDSWKNQGRSWQGGDKWGSGEDTGKSDRDGGRGN